MMRAISLLLLVPFLTVQAWALSGGPYDGFNGRSMAAFSGTYGVVMNGIENPADTGIMTMTIPTSGMLQSRVLIFRKGLMYLGSSMGTMDQRDGSITLMSQMSHFASRTVTDGIQKQSGVFVDSMLTGKMGMNLVLNYFSGMLEVGGEASYYEYDPMLSKVTIQVSNGNRTQNAGQNYSTDISTNGNLSGTFTGTIEKPDIGISTPELEGTAFQNRNQNDGTNKLSLDSTTTTLTETIYNPDVVRQHPIEPGSEGDRLVTFRLDGVRQDTSVAALSPFTPPSEETFFQIEVALPAGGGAGTGAGGAGGNGGAAVRTN